MLRPLRPFGAFFDFCVEKFMAEDDEDNMTEVEVEASIPFRYLRVWFENSSELSIPAAVQAVTRFAAQDELGEPSESFSRYVDIPLLGNWL